MAQTFWPTPQDYNEAIQNPSVCIADADLCNGSVDTNQFGLPRSMTGAFASVYKITNGEKMWAVRCFLSNRQEQQDRYRHISEFVLMDDLECTIDFYYIENGIKIRGEWFPILKMPWVEGDTLDRYVFKNYKNTELMKTLLSDFHRMMSDLARAQISHGDLQHGNILVSPDGLRLVDYDALFVPALVGKKSLEVGHPSFQHPERTSAHYNKDVDNFSAWLIHAGLLSITIDSDLYEKYCNGDDNLLFRRTDLANPEASELFTTLSSHSSENIKAATELIRRMLWSAPSDIPRLDSPAEDLARLPHSKEEKLAREKDDSESNKAESEQLETQETAQTELTQVTDFSWIDAEVAMTRASAIPVEKPGIVDIVYDLTAKGWDKFSLWFSLYTWVENNMRKAKSSFDVGEYEAARKTYHRVYKTLEAANTTELESYSFCLLRLGCCYRASDTPALASNYFLLALQNSPKDLSAKPALYLALLRFQSGDKTGALRLLTEHINSKSDIRDVITTELRYHFLDRLALFKLLIEFSTQLLNAPQLELGADAIYCSWLALRSFLQTEKVDDPDLYIDEILNLLALLQNTSKVNQTYEDIAQFCWDSASSNRGAIAYVCTALRDHVDRSKDEPLSVKSAIVRIGRLDLNSADLALLKKNALSVAEPDHVRDILVRISKQLVQNELPDTASNIIKIAFDITAEFSLLPTYEMLSEIKNLELQVHCLESVMESHKAFKHLILYLGSNYNHFPLLIEIAKFLLRKNSLQQLARLLTIVEYGCPETVFEKLCSELNLPDERREEIEAWFEKRVEALGEFLKVSNVVDKPSEAKNTASADP